jgi:hypothetical protein
VKKLKGLRNDEKAKKPLLIFFIDARGGGDNNPIFFDQFFENSQKMDDFFLVDFFTKNLFGLAYDFHFLSPISLFITYFRLPFWWISPVVLLIF